MYGWKTLVGLRDGARGRAMMPYRFLAVAAVALIVAAAHTARADAAEPGLVIELNKLAAAGGDCRAYLLFENGTGHAFTALTLDLVVFDADGVISKRLAVNAAPLAAGKTTVKVFDIDGVPCAGVGRMLLNGLAECRYAEGGPEDCLSLVETRSKAAAELIR